MPTPQLVATRGLITIRVFVRYPYGISIGLMGCYIPNIYYITIGMSFRSHKQPQQFQLISTTLHIGYVKNWVECLVSSI